MTIAFHDWRTFWLLLALAPAACAGFEEVGTLDSTATGSATGTGSDATTGGSSTDSGTDGGSGSSSTGDTGETGAVIACEDQLDEAACDDARIALGPDSGCAWVEVRVVLGEGAACDVSEPEARCIPTTYQGDGCGVSSLCGDEGVEDSAHYRMTEAGLEVFVAPLSGGVTAVCEFAPDGFSLCSWDPETGALGPEFPAGCDCLCP